MKKEAKLGKMLKTFNKLVDNAVNDINKEKQAKLSEKENRKLKE
ncbi:hypothetical protein [Methanobacterium sp.]